MKRGIPKISFTNKQLQIKRKKYLVLNISGVKVLGNAHGPEGFQFKEYIDDVLEDSKICWV